MNVKNLLVCLIIYKMNSRKTFKKLSGSNILFIHRLHRFLSSWECFAVHTNLHILSIRSIWIIVESRTITIPHFKIERICVINAWNQSWCHFIRTLIKRNPWQSLSWWHIIIGKMTLSSCWTELPVAEEYSLIFLTRSKWNIQQITPIFDLNSK